MEASRFFSSDDVPDHPPNTPPIIVRAWRAIRVFYADPRRFGPPTYAQLAEIMIKADPDQTGSAPSLYRAHRDHPDLLPWPIRRGMRPPWETGPQLVDNVTALDPGWVHVGWSCDEKGAIFCCTDSLPAVLGYASKDEVVGHPGTRMLVPSARPGDPRIAAIVAGMQRLQRGDTAEELISEYIEARDGTHIECHAVMTFRVVQPPDRLLWDIVADVRPRPKMKQIDERVRVPVGAHLSAYVQRGESHYRG